MNETAQDSARRRLGLCVRPVINISSLRSSYVRLGLLFVGRVAVAGARYQRYQRMIKMNLDSRLRSAARRL